jgi:hypothetical protein
MSTRNKVFFALARVLGAIVAALTTLGIIWFSESGDFLSIMIGIGLAIVLAVGSIVSQSVLQQSQFGSRILIVGLLLFGSATAWLNFSHWSWFDHGEDRTAILFRAIFLAAVVFLIAIRVALESRRGQERK